MPPHAVQELARDVRGADVKLASGGLVGEIERIMIDTDTMHVAYVLVAHGGFLGFDETSAMTAYRQPGTKAKLDLFSKRSGCLVCAGRRKAVSPQPTPFETLQDRKRLGRSG